MDRKIHFYTSDKSVQHLIKRDKRLAMVIGRIGDIEANIDDDPYAFLVGEIIGQMLSNKVADVIYGRLEGLCGGSISVESMSGISVADLRGIGLSNAKSNYVLTITDAVRSGSIRFEELETLSDDEVMKKLMSYKGIGSWTAKMYLLFVLKREDIVPYEDGAFLQSFKWLYGTKDVKKDDVLKKAKKWHPYSSIAARYLYRALDSGLIKESFSSIQEKKGE